MVADSTWATIGIGFLVGRRGTGKTLGIARAYHELDRLIDELRRRLDAIANGNEPCVQNCRITWSDSI